MADKTSENFLLTPNFTRIFLQTVFFLFLFGYLAKLYWKWRPLSIINRLPGLKVKSYHIFGHLKLPLPHRIKKLPLPLNIYEFQGMSGYNYLFFKKGITHAWQAFFPFITVFKPEYVEIILNHSTELKKAWFYDFMHPWLGTGLLTSYDKKWKSRRKLLTPAFHFSILRDFLPVFNKQSKILVENLQKHTKEEYVDIVPLVTLCSLDIICESILGKVINSQTQPSSPYVIAVHELTEAIFGRMQQPWLWSDFLFPYLPFGKRFKRNKNTLHEFANKIITEKKKIKLQRKPSDPIISESTDDLQNRKKKRALLDLLLDEHVYNNSISEDGIREEVDTFTFEGHDTTSLGMSWALYLIGLHPWVQNKVHEELDTIFDEDNRDIEEEDLKKMKYLECVLKESLRLYPSVPTFGREIREDLDFCGYTVPKGATCLIQAYLLHRDPETFPNPEKFDPERFSPENSAGRHPFAYVPFSAGPRNCIGQRFALMEMKTVLSFILRKYKVRSLDPRDKVHVVDELVLRPYLGLRLQIKNRNDDFDFHSVYYRHEN